ANPGNPRQRSLRFWYRMESNVFISQTGSAGQSERHMSTVLDKIVASKRQEIENSRRAISKAELERRLAQAPPVRDFRACLEQSPQVAVIAEVKKASPSAGVLRTDFDPVTIADIYSRNGAAAISVLTDAPFFQGHLSYLSAIRQSVALPVLRKD